MYEQALSEYCKTKQVPEQVRASLGALPEGDLEAVVGLIQTLAPSSNSLRAITELLADINHRDVLCYVEILDRASLSTILSSSGSSKDKQIRLKNALLKIRYPEKYTIEESLNQLSSEIRNTYNVKIIVPVELEGDQLQVSISFRDGDSLASIADNLRQLAASAELKEVFSILKGEI